MISATQLSASKLNEISYNQVARSHSQEQNQYTEQMYNIGAAMSEDPEGTVDNQVCTSF